MLAPILIENGNAAIPMAKTVLFVDDENDWRFMASSYLEESGFKVLTARNGTEALLVSGGVQLNAIVLDINLAGENGVVFIEFLKRNHPGVPVLLYTSMDHDKAAIEEMLKKGAHQYLRKGSMQDLLAAVQSAAALN
ncbi:MAG TPA: response regulator [Verrucomicrobiae bacterium]|jgi:DNA-binding NtrC family response regulator|nr:response regulator [Verrucomicrobiae bacterium]